MIEQITAPNASLYNDKENKMDVPSVIKTHNGHFAILFKSSNKWAMIVDRNASGVFVKRVLISDVASTYTTASQYDVRAAAKQFALPLSGNVTDAAMDALNNIIKGDIT